VAELTERERRLAKIDELRLAAARLRTLAHTSWLRARIASALSELDDAARRLADPEIDRRPSAFQVVDVSLTVALTRLQVVDEVVARHLPLAYRWEMR